MGATGPINYLSPGDKLDYTPAAAITAGTAVLQNDLVASAPVDIAANLKGAVQVKGAFTVNKDTSSFFAGQRVYFDMVNLVATSDPTKGPLMGAAIAAQLTGDATVMVTTETLQNADTYYVQQAAGASLTNSAVETTLSSANFPPNRLQVGDVIKFFFQGIAVNVTADTLQIKGYIGLVNFFTSAAQAPTAGDIFQVDGQFVVRALGNAATGVIIGSGTQGWGTPGTVTSKPWNIAATNIDTTIAELFKFTGKYSAAAAGDLCRSDILNIELCRQN